MGSTDDIKSTLTQSALDALCEKFHIPDTVQPKLPGHPHPTPTEFDAELCDFLAIHPAPFWKFLESFLCLVGISRYYELDDSVYPVFLVDDHEEMDLFAIIHHADPTKVRIEERKVREGEDAGVHVVNEEGGNAAVADQTKQSGYVVQDEGANIVVDDKIQATVANKPKGERKKKKAASRASGTLPVKVGVAAVATLPFVNSFVTLMPEREEGDRTNSVTRPNMRTQHQSEKFMVLSDSPCHSSSNALDVEVSFIVKSLVSNPPIMTIDVATSFVADTSFVLVPRAGYEPVHQAIFADSASMGEADLDVSGPSHPASTELFMESFYVSRGVDPETLHQVYIPKWNVTNDSSLDDPDVFRGVINYLAHPVLFPNFAIWTTINYLLNLMLEWHAKHALALSLKEQTMALEGQVVDLESAASSDYLSALRGTIGHAIDKGMHDGLATSIEHGKAGRGLVDVAANNPFAKTNYVFAVNVLYAGTRRLSLFDAMIPLIEPLSVDNLVGEASTFGVSTTATTTALSTTFIQARTVPPIPVVDYEVLGAGPSTEVPSP
uniref:Transposase (Putative), gypsy type n=1 Tax=Tanacetum cinerariifolium TaxID=118510 RepID=A0A699IR27_TANCI|nr:transposase (putative), gypsy type [Tanacetum cinerariifolium]